jgi:hypothetical protein
MRRKPKAESRKPKAESRKPKAESRKPKDHTGDGAVRIQEMPAPIEIVGEQELASGWAFAAQALSEQGRLVKCELRLSFVDYNLWSPDGSIAPVRVAEAVLAFIIERVGARGLPPRFDAAQARRMFPDADQQIRELL